MADYVKLSMPRDDAKVLLALAEIGRNVTTPEWRPSPLIDRAIRRLRLLLQGKNLRAANCKHNTHLSAQERQQAARRKWS